MEGARSGEKRDDLDQTLFELSSEMRCPTTRLDLYSRPPFLPTILGS